MFPCVNEELHLQYYQLQIVHNSAAEDSRSIHI